MTPISAKCFSIRHTQGFIDEDVTELIVDLRYNLGGDMRAALHLGSIFAPVDETENEEIIVSYLYNGLLTSELVVIREVQLPVL